MKMPNGSSRDEGNEERSFIFPVAGMDPSTGGATEVAHLLQHLPANTGMAFVLIPHPGAPAAAALTSALTRQTTLPVKEVAQRTNVEPNHVYVIPPDTAARIADSVLELAPVLEMPRATCLQVAADVAITVSDSRAKISAEELQSANEDLKAANEELKRRNWELRRLNDLAILSSTAIEILAVDNQLRIRGTTSAADDLFGIRPSEVGRRIGDIRLHLGQEDLEVMIRRVIDTRDGEVVELLDRENRWRAVRITASRGHDNRMDGAVLAMIDSDQLLRAEHEARQFAESLVESVQIPLMVLRDDLRIRSANRAFLAFYALRSADAKDRTLDEIGRGQWSIPEFKLALARLSRAETLSEEIECAQDIPGRGRRTVMITARRVYLPRDRQFLLAVHDITEQKRLQRIMTDTLHETEDELRLSREELRALTGRLLHAQDEERRRVSRELHDDVSQNMARLQFDVEALEHALPPDLEDEKTRLQAIRDDAAGISNDLRRIAYALHPSTLDILGLADALSAFAAEFSKRTGIAVDFDAAGVPAEVPQEIARSFYRIAQEALRNVGRHSAASGASIRLSAPNSRLTLSISDSGRGFDRMAVRGRGGLGVISMEERARLIRASFQLDTAPGQGVSITVSVPLATAAKT